MRTEVQLRRHAGGKPLLWLLLPAAHVFIRLRRSPGGTGGYLTFTSAAYENQAFLPVTVLDASLVVA